MSKVPRIKEPAPRGVRQASRVGEDTRADVHDTPLSARLVSFLRDNRLAAIWLGMAACVVIWRPFVMGFYADDWSIIVKAAERGAAFSAERWHYASFNINPTRPGMAPLWFVLSSLFGRETLLWHTALLTMNLTMAGLIAICVQRFLRASRGEAAMVWIVAACWMLLPWGAPVHFWPTEVPVLITVAVLPLLLLLVIRVLKSSQLEITAIILIFALYLWSCMSYEAVYFQFIPVLLLSSLAPEAVRLVRVLYALLPLIGAQGCAVVWHYYAQRLRYYRSVEDNWLPVLIRNISGLPHQLLLSAHEVGRIAILAMAVLLAITAIIYTRTLLAPRTRREAVRSIASIGVCLVGALLSIVAFSLGSRAVFGIGVDARTLMIFSIWLTMACCIGAVHMFRHAGRVLKPLHVVAFTIGVLLATASQIRALEWADSWRIQQQVLNDAPAVALHDIEPGAALVVMGLREKNGIPVFSQPWIAEAMLETRFSWTRRGPVVVYNRWLGPLAWDGRHLFYKSWDIGPATRVYVWDTRYGQLTLQSGPFRIEEKNSSLVLTNVG